MNNLVVNTNGTLNGPYDALEHTGTSIKKRVLFVLEEGALIAHDIYSLKGLEVFTKAMISTLKFLSLFPAIKGVFKECLKTLEMEKELYYFTAIIDSCADFVDVKKKTFVLPREEDKKTGVKTDSIDYVKILYAIGNVCETGKFLQKYQVFAFQSCTNIANRMGALKVFNTSYTMGEIPVVNALCDKPKDFFIFIASGIDVYKCVRSLSLEWDNILQCTSSLGKLLLISLGNYHGGKPWFVLIDVITQYSTLIKWAKKRINEREKSY